MKNPEYCFYCFACDVIVVRRADPSEPQECGDGCKAILWPSPHASHATANAVRVPAAA
jgi:hypothetical protein